MFSKGGRKGSLTRAVRERQAFRRRDCSSGGAALTIGRNNSSGHIVVNVCLGRGSEGNASGQDARECVRWWPRYSKDKRGNLTFGTRHQRSRIEDTLFHFSIKGIPIGACWHQRLAAAHLSLVQISSLTLERVLTLHRLLSSASSTVPASSYSYEQPEQRTRQRAALPPRAAPAQLVQLGGVQDRDPRALPRERPAGPPRAALARLADAVRARRGRGAQVGRGRPAVQGAHRAQRPPGDARARV